MDMTDEKAREILKGVNPEYHFYDGVRKDQTTNPGEPIYDLHQRWLDPTSTSRDPHTLRVNGSFSPQELIALGHLGLKNERTQRDG